MASVTFAGGREDTLQRFLDPDHCQELKIQRPLTLFAQRSVCYRELLHAQVQHVMKQQAVLLDIKSHRRERRSLTKEI